MASNPAMFNLPAIVVASSACCTSSKLENACLRSPNTSISGLAVPSEFVKDILYSSIAAAQSAVGLAKFARIDLSLLPDSEDLIVWY